MLFHFSKETTGGGVLLFEQGKLTRYKLDEEYEDSTSNWSISNFPDSRVEFKYPESDSLFKHNHARKIQRLPRLSKFRISKTAPTAKALLRRRPLEHAVYRHGRNHREENAWLGGKIKSLP